VKAPKLGVFGLKVSFQGVFLKHSKYFITDQISDQATKLMAVVVR